MFAPRREHARFCSARCRVAWNRRHASGSPADTGALDWAVIAMRDTTSRLLRAGGWDRADGFAVISEAVWWVTMVDATLVRYRPDVYGGLLAGQDPARRRITEDTFGGLRFVRNRMGYDADHADFVAAGGTRARHAQPARRRLDLEIGARARASHPDRARTGVGADPLPRVPGPAGGAFRRGYLHSGRIFSASSPKAASAAPMTATDTAAP